MHTLAVLLVAAATTGQSFGKPHVGGLKLFRHDAVVEGPAPPGGPTMMTPGGPGGAGLGPQAGRRFPNVRSQITFLDPVRMNISWQTSAGPNGEKAYAAGVTVPASYNFLQGYIYRLKLTDIPNRDRILYPTIEVAPSTPATDAYLTHNAIPVQFTDEDFQQVIDGGNFVTKVIYLPDPKYQELAIAGVETLVSTRLEPGVDPIIEADKRGTILLIIRLGGINLEMNSNSVGVTGAAPVIESGPVDTLMPGAAPVTVRPPMIVPAPPAEAMPPTPAPAVVPAPVPAPVPAAPVRPTAPAVVPAPLPTPAPPVVDPAPVPPPVAPRPAAPESAGAPAPTLEPALPVPAVEAPLPVPALPSL